jgi:disulfide bond formation protein DsbB
MYPIVVIGVVALAGAQPLQRTAVAPLALAGFSVAGYHSWLQLQPSASGCTVGGCASIQWQLWGLLSIPNLAAIAFALIVVVVLGAVLEDERIAAL